MAKTERKYMAHFINAKMPGTSTNEYIRLGKDLEEYNVDMSAEVETAQNILGETSTSITGYEKSGTVEPYFHDSTDKLADRLQDIYDNSRVLDDCNSDMIEVHMWGINTGTAFPAIKNEGAIELTSAGGDTTGYQFAFNFHYTGTPIKGTFDTSTKTFVADD